MKGVVKWRRGETELGEVKWEGLVRGRGRKGSPESVEEYEAGRGVELGKPSVEGKGSRPGGTESC